MNERGARAQSYPCELHSCGFLGPLSLEKRMGADFLRGPLCVSRSCFVLLCLSLFLILESRPCCISSSDEEVSVEKMVKTEVVCFVCLYSLCHCWDCMSTFSLGASDDHWCHLVLSFSFFQNIFTVRLYMLISSGST